MTASQRYLDQVARRLGEAIAFEAADKDVPSISYALVDRDGVIASGHFQRGGASAPLGAGSHFRIGSLTKMFTAIGIMQLAERGLVDLDADVGRYLSGFAPKSPGGGPLITPRLLLSHTSGLVREAAVGHYLDGSSAPLPATVASLAGSTLKEDSGAGIYRYSNAGFAVAGAVIEAVSGMPYAKYLASNILGPLEMSDTAIALTPAIRSSLAPACMWDFDSDNPAPLFDLGCAPAGNIFSTVPDVAQFASALLRGGFSADGAAVVSPASLRQMWTPARRADSSSTRGYGLGFAVDSLDGWQSVGHGGVVYGYASLLTLLPMAGLGIVLFSTLDFTNQMLSRLSVYGLRLALAARGMGKAPDAPRQLTLPNAAQIASLPGTYRTTDGQQVELVAKSSRLYLVEDGVPLEFKPVAPERLVLDGRIHGEGTDHPHATLQTPRAGVLTWKDREWTLTAAPAETAVPAALAGHLGTYGPQFNPTYLSYRRGELLCPIEVFCPHTCEPLGGGKFRMHGSLYENETLALGATDEAGRHGISVGEMFLARNDT